MWKYSKIEAIAAGGKSGVVGGPFGSSLTQKDYTKDGIPVIRGSNMGVRSRYISGDFVFVSEEKAQDLSANLAFPGDVIVTQRGTLGQIAMVPEGCGYQRYVISQSQMKITTNREIVDAMFAYYYLKSQVFQNYIMANAIQTGVPHINLAVLRNAPFIIPPMSEQRGIAHILGSIDGKIELNEKVNKTINAMVLALFRSWFVDFDPVCAKEKNQKPAFMDETSADLFPNSFEEGRCAKRPKGWLDGKLLDLCELKRGYDLPGQQRVPGPYPIVSSSGITDTHAEAMVRGPGIVTGRYGTIGEVYFIEGDFWPLNTALYVRDFKGSDPLFVYHMLKEVDFSQYSDKAAVPGINRNHLHEASIVLPPKAVQRRFTEMVEPLWRIISANQAESRTLAELRDLLLPKLMSGEIRVKDAERMVGDVS